ncbi:uncharacterized protein LOC131151315 [Malania oleifera]|uniref:uncharacterized protein LOC131151315 n=1 Tax=Malania oleifera TaxID=397392 RepID=UPI0025AE1900|nr:uncharacterized protein LOC131151315 [Malania oleifera]
MKEVMRFRKKGKLGSWYIKAFEILERISPIAYQMALPPALSRVHDVFHVSVLRKYMPDPSHVLSHEPLKIRDVLVYEEVSVQILDQKLQKLRTKEIPLVKVTWQNHTVEEASWELEKKIREYYFESYGNTRNESVREILELLEKCRDFYERTKGQVLPDDQGSEFYPAAESRVVK